MPNFFNFGFETGTVDGWTQGGGFRHGSPVPVYSAYLPGGTFYDLAGSHVTIMSGGVDARTDNVLNRVHDGLYSVMINNPGAGAGVSLLTQQVSNYGSTSISFSYAGVIEKAHRDAKGAGFQVILTDDTTDELLYSVVYSSATATQTFTRSSSNWLYQSWQDVDVDTSARLGHDFTLTVISYDCSQKGHAGYVYLDGFEAPSGQVAGNIYHDYDRDGGRDTGEPALAGWTVYVDGNGNGLRDPGETTALTDAAGGYLLTAVPTGTATIRVDAPVQTWERWDATALSVVVEQNTTSGGADIGVAGGATPFNDRLHGVGRQNEIIDGLAGNDRIKGRAGNDDVSGGIGNDKLGGGGGDDLLSGGEGRDKLLGGSGADVFSISSGGGRDTIADFADAQGDRIRIDIASVDGFEDLTLTGHRGGTLVTLAAGGSGERLFLAGVDPATLVEADFLFGPAGAPVHEPAMMPLFHVAADLPPLMQLV